MSVVALRGVTKSYPGAPHPVLERLDLEVSRGQAVALVGRSGSGKTTLINLVAGLTAADQGRVEVMGEDIGGLSEDGRTDLRRRHLGVVYQHFNLLPTLTAEENLLFPLALNGMERDQGQVQETLSSLGLEGAARQFPWQMSGGEQQRLAVGRALIHRPALLLADEPTGNLDLENAHQVMELLLQRCRQDGVALLLVTHSSELSGQLDRVVEIRDRQIHEAHRSLASS
ncbi:MAG: ABC transporter ATP-binding protein [Xanthomonadales bacterium]|nr:ABC transporter ATP-binding protein [Xanthomonadales bacterium]